MISFRRLGLALMLLLFLMVCIVPAFCAEDGDFACTGGKVYPSPTEPPIENATLLVHDGKIVAVAPGYKLKNKFPRSAVTIDCKGKVIVAGFWNSHVHFTTGWDDVPNTSVSALSSHMQHMLTRWGFTTVWDLGSEPNNTLALRQRIESGEIPGPHVLMAGDIFPEHGHPVYLPPEMKLPEAATPQQATAMAKQYLEMGLDGIKLFTGAFMGDKPTINMPADIVKAAVDVAHGEGRPVFAHPQNRTGADNALAGGVDILAHTLPIEGGFTPDELARMKEQHTALIPTFTLWTTVTSNPRAVEQIETATVAQMKSFFSEGGTILFGTDVGFITIYDTTREFEFMGRALGWRDILASLTTNPSDYFKASTKGRVERDMDADLVILDADPATDVKNFAKVAYTIRGGRVIYQK
ncbi:MAG: amidohydrolase family protein [Candidatus Korobacteraceae bacterium]